MEELPGEGRVDGGRGDAGGPPPRPRAPPSRRGPFAERVSLAASALGAIGGFFAIAHAIAGTRSTTFDRATIRRLGRVQSPVSDAIGRVFTFFGSVPGAGGVAATALVLSRRSKRLATQVLVGALGSLSAELVIKRAFLRRRPTRGAHLDDVGSSSFPSGHATAAASLYLTLAFVASRTGRLRAHRASLLAGAGAFAAGVGASRVYLGVHWPTDVLGGFALGTAWACLVEIGFTLAEADGVERAAPGGRRSLRARRPGAPPAPSTRAPTRSRRAS